MIILNQDNINRYVKFCQKTFILYKTTTIHINNNKIKKLNC